MFTGLFGTLSVPSLSIERSTGPFSQIFSLCSKFGHSCSSPYNPKNNKKAIRYEYLMAFLVRWKGLEPPTYWFVASHSIQLSYQRVYVLHFLCFNTITQIKSKCNTFFIFYMDYLKYIFQVYHRRVLQVQGKGAFCNTLLCVFRQSVNPAPALKCREVHGI